GVYALLAITAIAALAWMLPGDAADDDLAYHCVVQPVDNPYEYMDCEGPMTRSLGDALHSCYNHYVYVYGRLADKIMILSVLLPVRVANAICGLCIALFATLLLACGNALLRTGVAAAGIALMWLLPPWHDLHSERAYIFNYVLCTCLVLGFIMLYSSRRTGVWPYVAALLAGMSQEAFGAAAMAYVATDMICNGADRRRKLLAATLSLGIILMMLSPGTWQRFLDDSPAIMSSAGTGGYLAQLRLCLSRIAMAWLPLVACLGAIVYGLKSGRLAWRSTLPWLAMMAVSMLMSLYFLSWGRILWMAYSVAIILTLRLAATWHPKPLLPPMCRNALWVLAALVYCLWAWRLAADQKALSDVHRHINASLADGTGHVVETVFPDRMRQPWYTAAIIQRIDGKYRNTAYIFGRAWKCGSDIVYAPEGYGNLPLAQWPSLPGRNNIYGRNGCYYTPDSCGQPALEITFGEYTPSASPLDRVFGFLRGYYRPGHTYTHQALNYYFPAGEICGMPVNAVYLGDLPRSLGCREILRVDTLSLR
ncbi:MAG: hypothetical protein K2L80_04765, partial [Muribaculaceae bacterium]|nr:hypothetical protein [Muribaculaceae bacterium]